MKMHILGHNPAVWVVVRVGLQDEFFGAQSVEENITSLSIVLQHLQFICGSFTVRFSPIKEVTLQTNTHNSPNGGVMSKNRHFHFMLPTSKISTIKVRTSTVIISLARRYTLLGCETKAMTTKSYGDQANGDQISDTTCRIESMSRGG